MEMLQLHVDLLLLRLLLPFMVKENLYFFQADIGLEAKILSQIMLKQQSRIFSHQNSKIVFSVDIFSQCPEIPNGEQKILFQKGQNIGLLAIIQVISRNLMFLEN
jgi:hypothetical protein